MEMQGTAYSLQGVGGTPLLYHSYQQRLPHASPGPGTTRQNPTAAKKSEVPGVKYPAKPDNSRQQLRNTMSTHEKPDTSRHFSQVGPILTITRYSSPDFWSKLAQFLASRLPLGFPRHLHGG